MFTAIASFLVVGLAIYAQRGASVDLSRPNNFDDDQVRQSVVFAREELRIIAFLLAGVMFMLGIIADRL